MSIGKLMATLLPVEILLPMGTLLTYRVRLDLFSPFYCHEAVR
jgi:hypothetical protein